MEENILLLFPLLLLLPLFVTLTPIIKSYNSSWRRNIIIISKHQDSEKKKNSCWLSERCSLSVMRWSSTRCDLLVWRSSAAADDDDINDHWIQCSSSSSRNVVIFSQLPLKLFPQAQQLPALHNIFSHLQQHQQHQQQARACVKRACTRAQYLLMREFRAGALLLLLVLCGRRHVASRLRSCAAARRRAATI